MSGYESLKIMPNGPFVSVIHQGRADFGETNEKKDQCGEAETEGGREEGTAWRAETRLTTG